MKWVSIMLVLLIAALVGPAGVATAAEPFTIYVAPSGSTANSGLTEDDPVGSLEQAETVLRNAAPGTDVEVRIASGTYIDSGTRWTTYVDGHTISFMPLGYTYPHGLPPGGRPAFRSPEGDGGYWFWAELPAGHPGGDTGLQFYYLDVGNYATGGLAIVGDVEDINGRRLPVGDGMNGNTVYGMRFEGNGTLHNDVGTGYGGVVMHNSSGNLIRNNHFVHLENKASQYNLIHGVYLAHGASRNIVENNAFRYITGHPMNVRNDSNSNIVQNNVFERTGYPTGGYFSDWSCGLSCAETYNKGYECPSHGNEFLYNELRSSYEGGWMAGFIRQPGGPEYIGPPGCSNDGQVWLRTAGNLRP